MKNPIPQNWKLFWSVFSISCLLGGLTLALCMFLLPHRDEAERTAAIVLCALYAFFLLPDLMLAVEYFASRADRISPQSGFWVGYFFGDLIAIVLFLVAPVSGFLWFLLTLIKLFRARRGREQNDIFQDL